jgi:hypothetical protein
MGRLSLTLLTVLGNLLLGNSVVAQVANNCPVAPTTKLESFDTNVSIVIIKATTEMGSLSFKNAVVTVRCREITDTSSGRKEQGVAMEITQKGQSRDTLLIDYDEIPSLLSAFNYLQSLDVSVTSLNAFDALYTTKGGFRIAALGTRQTGAIQFAVRDARTNAAPAVFSREEMTRLWSMLQQAKATLDSIRGG